MIRVLAVLASAMLVLGATAMPSVAAPTSPAATATIALLEQPAWASLGADVPLRLRVDGPTSGLEVRAIIHAFVQSRTAFERTLGGERLGSVIASVASPADALPAASSGGRVLTLPLQDPNLPRDANRLRIPLPRTVKAGVYPLELELRDPETGERSAGFVTHLVAVAPPASGAPVGEPLRVSWIWRIGSGPAVQPDGKPTPAFLAATAGDGRLARIATTLTQAGNVPVTLAPDPGTLEAWAALARTDPVAATGVDAVRAAAQRQQVLTGPYAPIDAPSLEAAGLGDEVARELAQGADTLGQVLGTRVDPRTTYATPLDAASLARLWLTGVDRVVIAPAALAPATASSQFTPARPFALESQGRRFSTVQTDDALARLLEGDATPALRAQRFLAGLAVVALEAPNQRRGITIGTPARWNPTAEVLGAVLLGLREHPLLTAVSLDTLFAGVPVEAVRGTPLVRELAPIVPPAPAVTTPQYQAARSHLGALASMIGVDDPLIARGERSLLMSLTSSVVGTTGRRQASAYLDSIDASVHTFAGGIQAPQGRTVTLTSRSAAIPVSLQNATGRPVRVRVRLESDKLRFPESNERTLVLPPRNTTTHFEVEARASGTFPLRIVVTSEDGTLALQRARYTVRSTVVSGVGVFLTIGAGLFLALWWITHWRRSRRRPVPPPALAT